MTVLLVQLKPIKRIVKLPSFRTSAAALLSFSSALEWKHVLHIFHVSFCLLIWAPSHESQITCVSFSQTGSGLNPVLTCPSSSLQYTHLTSSLCLLSSFSSPSLIFLTFILPFFVLLPVWLIHPSFYPPTLPNNTTAISGYFKLF